MRSRHDRVIAGVAGGFADYFDLDPVLVRIAIVILALASVGAIVVVYVGAWIVMPEEPAESESAGGAEPVRRRRTRHERRRALGVGWGILLVAIGLVLLLRQLDIPTPEWDVVLSALLILVGLLIAFEGRRGLNGGLVAIAVVMTVILGAAAAVNFQFDGGFGERNVQATQVADLDASYSYAFGSLTLDLRQLNVPANQTVKLDLSIAFGNLEVQLPPGVAWRVETSTFLGSTEGDSWREDGVVSNRTHQSSDFATASQRIDIQLSNAFGSARIR